MLRVQLGFRALGFRGLEQATPFEDSTHQPKTLKPTSYKFQLSVNHGGQSERPKPYSVQLNAKPKT